MSKRWRFICASEPTSVIVVHDQWSADVLNRLLKGEIQGLWSMQTEEERQPTVKPAPSRARAAMVAPETPPVAKEEPKAILPDFSPPGAPPRKNPRYKIRLFVTLTNGINSFSSKTRDISLGGMALEEKLPAFFFGQYCRVQIYRSTDAERIDLRCKIFADPKNPRRLQFVDPPDAAIKRLAEWIEKSDDKTEVA
jgi:hypothetical protein